MNLVFSLAFSSSSVSISHNFDNYTQVPLSFISMKLTCLSKGDGYQYPPCHMLSLCGFRILIDCPLDLLAITIFSPVPYDVGFEASGYQSDVPLDAQSPIQKKQKLERQLTPADLVCAEPWYKTVKALHLWEDSLIDVVLISNPMGLLGLPFLTQNPRFCAKIYMTEATAKIGELMMEDLVSMHSEFRCFYGPENSSFPGWIKNLDHEDVPASLKKVVFGESGDDLGSWMRLYSLNDIKSCMKKVQVVKFAEEVCYNGTLMIKALSSGLDIGACNWLINGPNGSLSFVSSSIFVSHHAKDFDFPGLKGTDLLIYSDFSYLQSSEVTENDSSSPNPDSNCISTFSKDKKDNNLAASLLSTEDSVEEVEKLAFVCSCAAESADAGGSTLITITRIGIVLQLLELISNFLESSTLKVPIFVISSVAEELLAYTNIIPEWLCEQRQKMLISGEPSFGYLKFIKDKKIHLYPAIHSPDLITNWQEPCIVFAPHWSLRLGPSVQLLQRWRGDPKSLLVLEDETSSDLGLLPFRPISMKVLQCSFLSGIRLQKLSTLLSILQPKLVLLPDAVNKRINRAEMKTNSILYYYENKTLHVQRIADNANVEITTDLASKLSWRKLRQRENFGISRLNGELLMEDGKRRLVSGLEQEKGSGKALSLMHWGSLAPETLLDALLKLGITGSIECSTDENGSEKSSVIHIRNPPCSGLIETSGMGTAVITDNGNVASQILQAIDGILDGI